MKPFQSPFKTALRQGANKSRTLIANITPGGRELTSDEIPMVAGSARRSWYSKTIGGIGSGEYCDSDDGF